MTKISLIFFGSFQDYSSLVLTGLLKAENLEIKGVVTTPPYGVPNLVQVLAENQDLPVLTPDILDEKSLVEIEEKCGKPELILTAGYGKLLPESWLSWPSVAALNLHFSLLPMYRGANPAEWAILCNEKETGVTLIEMSPEFDTGKMVASASLPLGEDDTRQTVYEKLYVLGGEVLPGMLTAYMTDKTTGEGSSMTNGNLTFYLPPISQPASPTPYAARFRRDDGFIAWPAIAAALDGTLAKFEDFSTRLQEILAYSNQQPDAAFIERAIRALKGFPGVWTKIPTAKGEKRMKLLSAAVKKHKLELQEVQIEGKAVSKWAESKNVVT